MNRDDVFMVWAPPHGPWSSWVKPILFAYLRARDDDRTETELPSAPEWTPPPDGESAVVVDVPGRDGVWLGLALANARYRPVPLYNACPSPIDLSTAAVAVDVRAVIDAIEQGTWRLAKRALPIGAPPAFLLDASRRVGSGPYAPIPGSFDNRSISLPTDFPSANLLLSRGVRWILLVQQDRLEPQEDLAHTLLRWQQAGLRVEAVAINASVTRPIPITVKRPSLFRRAWYRTLAVFNFVRNPLGGFGGRVPEPSSSGSAG